ncbi:MAG TPA: phosphoethanolamine--lipid A transferase, partial [Steroidobacter sp.]
MNSAVRQFLARARSRWPTTIPCRSDVRFSFAVSALWLALYNITFWQHTAQAMWRPSFNTIAFLASLAILVLCLQALLLLLMPTRWLMRAAASLLTVIAALTSYFIREYGAIMNKDMLRNVLGTDAAEVGDLLNLDLVLYVLLLGLVPAWLVWRVSLPSVTAARQLQQRVIGTIAALILAGCSVIGFSAQYAVYFRAHKPIRYELSPSAPVISAVQVLIGMSAGSSSGSFKDLGGMAKRIGAGRTKPTVLFIVIGEAARAANFQLGGYDRPTTPRLASMKEVVYFSDVSACDTSTATSVPCMFSPLGRSRFDVDESSHIANLLDSLGDAGFAVEWRENNAGCKGVCDRVRTVRYDTNAGGPLCEHSYCYDEIMLEGLDAHIRGLTTDTAIVFHQIGSHGPAYWQRYPAALERFKPACRSNELHTCSEQQLINAYDNTVAYTDHILSRQIEILRSAAESVDSLLLYVSDHGESLGENGMYLHGIPYSFAPRVQKHVPMLMWASDGYVARTHLDTQCLRRRSAGSISHDNLYHTLLGAAEVYDAVYQPKLDLL